MRLKKLLALILCFAMVFSMMSFSAFAEEDYVAFIDANGNGIKDDAETTYDSIGNAITEVGANQTIRLTKNISDTVNINKDGVKFTIDGKLTDDSNVKYTGVIEINQGNDLTIKNIDFVHEDETSHDFIINKGNSTGKNFNTTLLVDGCSFIGNGKDNTVGVKTIHPTHVTVQNSTGTKLHSLMQNTGGQKVTIDNVTVTDSKSGISLGGVRTATVKNSKIEASDVGYGIRIDAATANAAHTIESCEVSAFIPVVVRDATADNVSVVFAGESNMKEANTDGFWCVVADTEYEENGNVPTDRTGDVALTLCDGGLDAEKLSGAAVKEPAIKIGATGYISLADALNAAKNMTGDVIVEIYDKVTLKQAFSGSYSSIKFIGKDTDAEIYLDVQGYITATGKAVAFEDLKLSKSPGGYMTNAGFMNVAFGVYDVNSVEYTNCTFLNGAYASSGKNTFTKCIFKRSNDKYGLWAYGNVETIVDNCVFDDYRGIKMYAEGKAKTVELTVKNTDFSAVTDKPAIVLTYGESVNLEDNEYSSTGVFELDLDGAPNGTVVTSNEPITCTNDNGDCGVLVNDKIYTTVSDAAAVAKSGDKVTLLHDSTETVEFAMGVELDKNNFEAGNITVKVPDLEIKTAADLKAFADAINSGANNYAGKYVVLANDINLNNELWTPIGKSGDSPEKFKGTFDGQNHTISNLYVKQGADYHAAGLFGATNGTVKNLKIDGAYVESLSSGASTVNGTAVVAGSTAYGATIENVHVKNAEVKGNRYVAGIVGYMDGVVTNCSIENVTIVATPDNLTGSYDNGDKVGGIVGYTNSGATEVSDCELKGEISITGYRDIGGIVGTVQSTVEVSDNTNNSQLTITVDQQTNYYGDKAANANEFVGRNTPSAASTNNIRKEEASLTEVVIEHVDGLSGEGTEEKPFLINNLSDLIWFRNTVNDVKQDASNTYKGKYVKLNADIDLAGINWEPIGGNADKKAFRGIFDGGNHTISNLYIEKAGGHLGFFGYTSHFMEWEPKTIVKNITFNNVTVKSTNGGSHIGGVIANSGGWTDIENVHVKGKIDISGGGYIGGIIGHGYPKVNNCSVIAEGTIKSNFWCAGGILGYAGEGSTVITNCVVRGIGENKLLIQSVAGGVAAVVGMPTGVARGENLTAENVKISTTNDNNYSDYKEYAVGYIFGNKEGATLGNIKINNVTFDMAGNTNPSIEDLAAAIDETAYETITEAIAAAKETDIVKLLDNADDVIDAGDKTVYIDPNGYDITKGIKSNGVTVEFDDAAKATLETQAADKGFAVTVKDADITDSVDGYAPSRVLNINVKTSDGTAIFTESAANGTATVSIPYTKSSDLSTPCVYYVADDGKAEKLDTHYENDVLTFSTSHFSQYAVVETINVPYEIKLEAEKNPANGDKFYNSGDKVKVNFTISSDKINQLGSFQFNFTYDATKLELLDIVGLGNAEGAFSADKGTKRISFDVDGSKPALNITGGKVVATAVFEVIDGASGATKIEIDNTSNPLEVTPQGYGKNEGTITVVNEEVSLSNIIITFKPGVNAEFSNGVSQIEARVDYKVPGFIDADFRVPADKLVADDGYRMAKDITEEKLWKVDGKDVYYTSEELKNTAFTENTTLIAQVVRIHNVTLVAGANGSLDGTTSFVVDDGKALTDEDIAKVKVIANPGYKFIDWTPAITTPITADDTIFTANFDHASFAVNNTVDPAIAIVTINSNVATHGTDVTFTVDPVNDNVTEVGYIIDGVKTPLTEAGGIYTIPGNAIVGDIDIYALTVDMYTVSFVAGANGELGGTTTFTVNKGETLTQTNLDKVTPVPQKGYKFVGYSIAGKSVSANDVATKEIYSNVTVTVLFDHATFNITDIDGVNTVPVTHGTDYTFTPEMAAKIVTNVTAKYSDNTDCPVVKNENGSYTIKGDAIIDNITLTAETVDGSIRFILNSEYKALKGRQGDDDEKIAVLETTKLSDKKYVLTNGAEFFWSEKYNAYVYIVAGLYEEDGMTEAMIASMLKTASGDADAIDYSGDITGDGKITAVDAQTITDILQQRRIGATPMLWRLRADVTGDKLVSTKDVNTVRKTAFEG